MTLTDALHIEMSTHVGENEDKENKRTGGQEEEGRFLEEKSADEFYLDGGWGWVVLVAASVVRMLKQFGHHCFGILFYELLADIGTTAAVNGWIFNVHIVMEQLSKLFVGPLGDVVGWRKIVMTCAVVNCASVYSLSFANHAVYLFIFFSVICGITLGLCTATSHIIIPHYFQKRVGRAMAVSMFSVCLGHFSGPLVITFLLGEYGYKGTMLILTAIFMHNFVAGTAFHPVSWHQPQSKQQIPSSCNRNFESKTTAAKKCLKKVCESLTENFLVMKWWKAFVLTYSVGCLNAANFNFVMLLSFVLQQRGHKLSDVAWCMSMMAASNASARVLCSVCSDWQFFQKKLVYTLSLFGLSGAILAPIYVTSLASLQAISVAYGIFCGICVSLYSLVMLEVLGLTLFKKAYGVSGFISAICAIAIGPTIGALKDYTGDYDASLCILSAIMLSAFLPCGFLICYVRQQKSRESYP